MSASITVGIPFFSKTISEQFQAAVDSVLAQSLQPDEVHLIQDGPVSEELSKVVKTYVESFSYIKHLIIEHNSGLAHAINFSILNTTSEYYARMDSDDIAHPQRLEKQSAFLEAHSDVQILGTWAIEFEENLFTEQGFVRQVPTNLTEMKAMFHYRNPFIHPTVMFRRSVFAKVGLYNVNFRLEEDLELWSRVFNTEVKVANLPEALLYYRFTGSIQRRAAAVRYQVKARYQFNTWSIKLNVLKFLSLLLKIMPYGLQKWAYKNLRA